MQVKLESTEDVNCVNWHSVAERISKQALEKIVDAMNRAAAELKELAPGEVRKFAIEIGTIEISRELSGETSHLATDWGQGPGVDKVRSTAS